VVALKSMPNGSSAVVRKHYQNGIMTHDDDAIAPEYNNTEF
jgi:hypothetical protein